MNVPVFLAAKPRSRALAIGSLAFAAAAIVLLRSPHRSPAANTPFDTRSDSAQDVSFAGPRLHGRFALTQGAVQANGTSHVLAELRLSADDATATTRPVAMAVVLDTSGSMEGEKIVQARHAVSELLERMRGDDEIALITYSDSTTVVQPLARVRDVRATLQQTISTIGASGGTMIPQALSAGANALAFAPHAFARRVVLVSDGQDGSGADVGRVANSLRDQAAEGISVSTLGLGADYDEAFMTRLADAGRGNYEYLRDGAQLSEFLSRELRAATSTTIDDALADVVVPSNWRLLKSYGAEPFSEGSHARLPIGSISEGDERTVVLEFQVDAGSAGTADELSATVHYRAVADARDIEVHVAPLSLVSVATATQVIGTLNHGVMASAQAAAVADKQREALAAWRRGDISSAQQIARDNADTLDRLRASAPSPALAAQASEYRHDAIVFGETAASSDDGRNYGLHAGAANHARAARAIGF